MSGLRRIRQILGRPDEDGVLTRRQKQKISERTKEGLAQARARGVKLGRPSGVAPDVVDRIRAERETMTLAAIAAGLNADGVRTAQGGARWYPSTVKSILDREEREP